MVYVSENKTVTMLQGHRPQVSCVYAGWSCELKVSGAVLVFFTLKKKVLKNQITCFSEFIFFFYLPFHITVALCYCSSSLLCLICIFP